MKVITTEVLMTKQIKVPVITGIYDLMSRRNDGTITSQGPIVVSGTDLAMLDLESIRLCLAPVTDCNRMIEIHYIYKYSHNRVIVSLPLLVPGEYFPAVKIMRREKEDSIYIFPVSWVVLPEGYARERSYSCYAKTEE